MLIDGLSATDITTYSSLSEQAIASFLRYISRKLGVLIVRDTRDFPETPELEGPLLLGSRMVREGMILNFRRLHNFPDEPRFKRWLATINIAAKEPGSGTTWNDDAGALIAALAEAQERYIWFTQTDFFTRPTYATEAEISKKGSHLALERIAGFSEAERTLPARVLKPDARYLWILGKSLVRDASIYLPAQVVSASNYKKWLTDGDEPLIRPRTTIGLASWPGKKAAELAGALEVIERDAYMVTWLNQLTLPRLSTHSLASRDPLLSKIFADCQRYRLKPHIIPLLTDAPTHAVAVILEDLSGMAPRFSIGLKAHHAIGRCVSKATMEALCARYAYRALEAKENLWELQPSDKVGHRDRIGYWAIPENAKHLEFLIRGNEIPYVEKPWERDSEEEHYARIIAWCKESGFECISVPFTSSKKNLTGSHINMVVIPELQPIYVTEATRAFGSNRWRDVPKKFGFTSRSTPFSDHPHPFA